LIQPLKTLNVSVAMQNFSRGIIYTVLLAGLG